jgi:hypothetical protein
LRAFLGIGFCAMPTTTTGMGGNGGLHLAGPCSGMVRCHLIADGRMDAGFVEKRAGHGDS